MLLLAEIINGILKERLALLARDVLVELLLVTLRVAHLTQNATIGRDDTLDGVGRTVGVEGSLHRRTALGIDILEGHLTTLKELLGQLLAYDKLTLAVADGNGVLVAQLKAREPGRTGRRNARRDDL